VRHAFSSLYTDHRDEVDITGVRCTAFANFANFGDEAWAR